MNQRLFRIFSVLILLYLNLTISLPLVQADSPVNFINFSQSNITSPTITSVNSVHGIDAPVGFRWFDSDRSMLSSFHNANGEPIAPGMVVALSSDMAADNNSQHIPMERDLYSYQQHGAQILVRMWPQRFPGGFTEPSDPAMGVVSGTPMDAAMDIFRFLEEQQTREGWHFTNIIPGNEMNIEWPNQSYKFNLLPWLSNDDPNKYKVINQFMLEIEESWQEVVAQPEGRIFSDVKLFFPAIAQDGAPGHFAGFNFYGGSTITGNKFDLLRPAIEAFGNFTWHNYWRPGHAWEDRAIANFPDWLKNDLVGPKPNVRLQGYITESGWSPTAMSLPNPNPILAQWRNLPFGLWQLSLNTRSPFTLTQDDTIDGQRFENDLQYFIDYCSGAAYSQPAAAQGVAVWLSASNGGFPEAAGLYKNSGPSRWLQAYAAWNR